MRSAFILRANNRSCKQWNQKNKMAGFSSYNRSSGKRSCQEEGSNPESGKSKQAVAQTEIALSSH
jgi:hypothetical protein